MTSRVVEERAFKTLNQTCLLSMFFFERKASPVGSIRPPPQLPLVHPGEFVQSVTMSHLMNHVELEREATTVLILEERRVEIRPVVLSIPFTKIK